MQLIRLLVAASAACLTLSAPLRADDHPDIVHVHDAYARISGGSGRSGAIFLTVHNTTENDDRLIAATTDAAEKAEFHSHVEDENGVMQMREIEGGIAILSGDMHALARGGDHLMLMGLTRTLKDGVVIPLTLTFESFGDVVIDVLVDSTRTEAMQHGSGHGMAHGNAAGNADGQMD